MADPMGTTRVVVNIFGEECALRGDAPAGRLRALAATVDARMRAVYARTPQLSKTRVAVLAALQLAEEVAQLQERLPPLPAPAAEPQPPARPPKPPAPPRTSRRRRT